MAPNPAPEPTQRTADDVTAEPVRTPEGYDPSGYPPFAVTVDVVVLAVVDDELQLALIRRGEDPHRGSWALPGGFKRPDETLDAAAARELAEEADLTTPRLAQFGAYGDPGRDPRMDVVTIGYYASVPTTAPLRAGTDADAARWTPVADVLDGRLPLAFDHTLIVRDAHARLSDDLGRTDAVLSLLPDEFTMSQLRRTYEAVWRLDLPPGPERDAFTLDRRNFRRQLTAPPGPFLVETGRTTSDVHDSSLPGRPAAYHRATAAWQEASPVPRPRAQR
jgi:8-oxo-dGTP diphosphatase